MAEVGVSGDKLIQLVKVARKGPIAFAFNPGPSDDSHVFALDKRKPAEFLARNAKREGDGKKVASGQCQVNGTKMQLQCETMVPGLAKKLRKFLKSNKLNFKVEVLDAEGNLLEADGEQVEEQPQATDGPTPDAEPDSDGGTDPLAEKWAQAKQKIGGLVADALNGGGGSDKLGALWDLANQKADSGDFATALKAFPAIVNLLKAPAAAADQGSEEKVTELSKADLVAEFKQLESKIRDLIASGSPAAAKLKEAAQGFVKAVKADKLDMAQKLHAAMHALVARAETAQGVSDTPVGASPVLGDDKLDDSDADIDEKPEQQDQKPEEKKPEAQAKPQQDKPKDPDGLDHSGVSDAQRKELKKIKKSNPELFDAVADTLAALDGGGDADASPGAYAGLIQKKIEADKNWQKARADAIKANNDLKEAREKVKGAGKEVQEAKAALDKAEERLGRHKGEEKYEARVAKAKKTLEALQEQQKAIVEDKDKKKAKHKEKDDQYNDAVKARDDAKQSADAAAAKRSLVHELTSGALSENADPGLSKEASVALVAAYKKQPDVVKSALDLLSTAKDPEAFAAHVGAVVDMMDNGFGGQGGNPAVESDRDRKQLAENALMMGARLGKSYADGFKAYYQTDAASKKDKTGGLGKPEKGKDREFIAEVSTKRSAMMANALLKDGKIDLDGAGAKEAMDHLMFHPGSLKTCTPVLIDQINEFRDFAKKNADDVQGVLDDCKKPDKHASRAIVRGTLGKDKSASVTQNDARRAVLSAMMTPVTQGPVGSCFATGPLNAKRQKNPLAVMKDYAEIATEGTYSPKSGDKIPANRTLPPGEHPLMRSLEYSVATASANLSDSVEKKKLNNALLGGGNGLSKVKDAVGAKAWRGGGVFSKNKDKGIKTKIATEVAQKLRVSWNAGEREGGAEGDGHSTAGQMELVYTKDPSNPQSRKAITSEAEFKKAMTEIALSAAGAKADSEEGRKIKAVIDDPSFIDSVKSTNAGGKTYEPWNLNQHGGFADQTYDAMDGVSFKDKGVVGSSSSAPNTKRATDMLKAMSKRLEKADGSLIPVTTHGDNCNHAFNLTPDTEGMKAISPPDADKKIDERLVKPGKEAAEKAMPASEAAEIFDEQMRQIMSGWGGMDFDLMGKAFEKQPDKDMTPQELKDHIEEALADVKEKCIENKSQRRMAELRAASKPVDEDEIRADFRKAYDDNLGQRTDTLLLERFPPPKIVFADTNWGGPNERTRFAAAPHPATGEVQMWIIKDPGGKMKPLPDNWVKANWNMQEPK